MGEASRYTESKALFETARSIRDRRRFPVTFSRNVFLPLTRRCRNDCTYCFFRREKDGEMSLTEVDSIARRGSGESCSEALFTFGEQPWKVSGTQDEFVDFLKRCLLTALDHGLLPHTNPGVVPIEVLEEIIGLNASIGVMLETTARLDVHGKSPGKRPETRVNFLDEAMSLGVPFTSGLLVGIGESWRDRAETLLALRGLQDRHSNLQEIIVQNVRPPGESGLSGPSREEYLQTIALTRVMFPGVSVQAPPNLLDPGSLLDAGVDDFGGVSPVTEDHVNPGADWPSESALRRACRERGLELRERLPIHPGYVRKGAYPEGVTEVVNELSDREGYRARD